MAHTQTEADMILADMAFAKIVQTERGEAVMIGRRVYHVTGPDGNAADAFSTAMRAATRGDAEEGNVEAISYRGPVAPQLASNA